jgi:3-deoxy-manno-octulosonate cytidylyltransferase (CMP-KDO synthetase)
MENLNSNQIDVAIIIPARYQSSRFPGKPMIDILGVSMIHRVWKQCVEVLPSECIFVATDSKEILSHCNDRNIQVIMTSDSCLTGTDRVYEAAKKINARMIINVQGDEPLVDPKDIQSVIYEANKYPDQIINAMCPITDEKDYRSVNIPKVVANLDGDLLYMSRSMIPTNKNSTFSGAWKQVCIYAFPLPALKLFSSVNQKTPLELIEDLEILRFLELGYNVKMIEVSTSSIAVDIPNDVKKVEDAIHAQTV